jgi:hypothetical protein
VREKKKAGVTHSYNLAHLSLPDNRGTTLKDKPSINTFFYSGVSGAWERICVLAGSHFCSCKVVTCTALFGIQKSKLQKI